MLKTVNFKPINNYVLVDLPEIEEKTKSGIIKTKETMAAEQAEQDDYLVVVAISDEVKKVKLGDKVLVSAQRLNMIRVNAKSYGLIDVDGVLGYETKIVEA